MAPLVDAENPSEKEIERRLLLAGDTPGYDMTSTLKRGDTPGGTVLELAGRYDPVTGFIGVANDLTEVLGDYSIGAGVNLNNLLGLGEVGYLQIGGWPGFSDGNFFSDDPRNRQIVAGFTVPLGTDGIWLNVEGVDSRTRSDTVRSCARNLPIRARSARLKPYRLCGLGRALRICRRRNRQPL